LNQLTGQQKLLPSGLPTKRINALMELSTMNQPSRNRLAQLQLSTILQLARSPEIKKLMTPAATQNLEKLKDIPESMIKSASFVIPDQPLNTTQHHEITLKKLLDWYSSPQNSRVWIKKTTIPENTAPKDSAEKQAQISKAKAGLAFMTTCLTRAHWLKEEAQSRYEEALQHWETTKSDRAANEDTAATPKAYPKMVDAATNLSTATDLFSLVFLHYQKYLNEIAPIGLDLSHTIDRAKSIHLSPHPRRHPTRTGHDLSLFTMPPRIMNDFIGQCSCHQLFCIANDDVLQEKYIKTGKPNYPAWTLHAYNGLNAPAPAWARKYLAEFTARMFQSTDFPSSAAAGIIGFHENGQSGHARTPWRWREEIKRLSARMEVLWREQETGASRTQIFSEIAKEYGCTEGKISDWFYEKIEKKHVKRKQGREEK
jgi:hypothetical protein